MSGIDGVGLKLGKIVVDKETGRTKVTQEVQGIDLGDYFTKIKKAKMVKVERQEDVVKINKNKLTALNEFREKALTLEKAVSTMANHLGSKGRVDNVMLQKDVSIVSSGGTRAESMIQISALNSAKVGSFNMKINQMATVDSYRTKISVPESGYLSALGLKGTFTLGMAEEDSQVQISITADMTLPQIVQAINNASDKTGVTADCSLISPSDPTGYELHLSAKQLGMPIVLQDNKGSILTSWNMTLGQQVSIQSEGAPVTINQEGVLNLTGDLVISAGDGEATTIHTDGLNLRGIVERINRETKTNHVAAEIVPIYAVNALSADRPIGYGLRLFTTNEQPLNLSQSASAVVNGLHLQSAIRTSVNAIVSAADKDSSKDQGLTGNLVIQAGSGGTPLTIDMDGKSLDEIVKEINDETTTTGIFAKLQVVVTANPNNSKSKNIYQLTLATNNGTSLITSESDDLVASGLGLDAPTHDYQALVAKVNVNGVDYQRFKNTVDDIVPGVTFDLKFADPSSTFMVDVTQSKEGAIRALKNAVTAYNDLNAFYKKHTAMKADFSGPEEEALLTDDLYVQQFMQKLQHMLTSVVMGKQNSTLTSLSAIGLKLDSGDGSLGLVDEKLWNEAINQHYDKLIALFGNTMTNSNDNFEIISIPDHINENIVGKDITFSLTNDSEEGMVGSIQVGEKTYEANVSISGDLIYLTPKDNSIGNFRLCYKGGTLADDQEVTTTINVVSGLMAKLSGFVSTETDSSKVISDDVLPPFDVKGAMMQNINMLQEKNNKLNEEISRLKLTIEKEMESEERKFDGVLKAKQNYEMVQGILKSYMKARG